MYTHKSFRVLSGSFVLAMILFASNASLHAQPFTKITTGQIATDRMDASGASWIDYDNDGDLDLFTSNRIIGNYVYRNEGNSSLPRVFAGGLTAVSSFGNSWADYDNDGDLDAMTVGIVSALHQNQGNGNFVDVTMSALGLGNADLAGWGCAWADFDNDRYVDLVIVHAAGGLGNAAPRPNFLFRNQGDGTFARISDSPVVMGVGPFTVPTWSDFDQDGDADLFIASGPANGTRARDYLYRNQLRQTGAATFTRINEAPLGTDLVDGQVWNWIDYDNDGDLDAYLTNYIGGMSNGQRNFLYRNEGGSYTSLTTGAIATDPGLSLAQVWGDFDNDGDLDLFVPNVFRTAIQGPSHFYRNDLSNSNHWVKLKLVGTSSNRDGIGAKIRAQATINGKSYWQLREASSQNTFCGQNSPEIHFGFGNAVSVDSLRLEWPLGQIDFYANVQANTVYEAVEGAGLHPLTTAVEDKSPPLPLGFTLEQNYPNPFNPGTKISFRLPVSSKVRLAIYNIAGQWVRTLFDRTAFAGAHSVAWDGRDERGQIVASGVYVYKLEAGEFVEAKKMCFVP